MKKLIPILLVLALLPVSGWAAFQAGAIAGPKDGPGMPAAGQLSLGVVNGLAKEHVYDYETVDGSRRQLSRLDWDLKSVAMGGVNGSVRLMDKLTLNGGYWTALTEGSGEMDDYDWMAPLSTDWTRYSLSDVDVMEGYIFDLNVAWDLLSDWNDLTARVFAGYKQDGWTWEDRAQFGIYDGVYWEGNDANMINYEQEFRMPYLGASADWVLGNFTLSGHLTYSPIVSATDWDDHVDRDMHYTEEFDGGDMFGAGLEARYSFTKGFFKGAFLSAALDYQQIDLIVGDTEYYGAETDGIVVSVEDGAGIENEYTILSVGGGIRF